MSTDALRDALQTVLRLAEGTESELADLNLVWLRRFAEIENVCMQALASPTEGAAITASREEALQTLAKFAKTAPGRLPQRIEDAIALAAQPAPPEGASRLTDEQIREIESRIDAFKPGPDFDRYVLEFARAVERAALAIQGAGGETEQPLGNPAQALPGERCGGPAGETER